MIRERDNLGNDENDDFCTFFQRKHKNQSILFRTSTRSALLPAPFEVRVFELGLVISKFHAVILLELYIEFTPFFFTPPSLLSLPHFPLHIKQALLIASLKNAAISTT